MAFFSSLLEQGPEGWLFFQMRGALGEYERAKILERTKRGLLGRAKAGHAYGASVPLGYRYISEPHGGRLEIDEDEAAVVRRIFDLCLSGVSTWGIARRLTEERLPTKRDRHPQSGGSKSAGVGVWHRDSVYSILTNATYMGKLFWNKRRRVSRTNQVPRARDEWVEVRVPPLVPEEVFAEVQAQLARNKQLATRNRKHEYLLVGGRLRCGHCGRTMSGISPNGKRRYRCNSIGDVADPRQRCHGSLNADLVEQRVWAAIEAVLQQPEIIAAEVTRQQADAETQRAEILREVSLVEDAFAKCDRDQQRWEQAYLGEAIDLHDFKAKKAEIATRRASLLAQRRQLQTRLDSIGQAVDHVEALLGYCARVRQKLQCFDGAEKRLALHALDIRVTWTPGQPLAIAGTIPLGEIVPDALGCRRR
jgi:site-specific DNA recombinase